MDKIFLGRENEKKQINNFFLDKNQNLALLYGRRRIGKTELLKNCINLSNSKSVYYECKETSEFNNCASLSEIISESLGFPPLAFNNFEEILNFMFKEAYDKEIILIIDEYSYLRSVIKGLDSIIQNAVDNFKDKSYLHLILCGSYVDTMKSLIEKQNPLYGRFDLIIDLKAMDYYDSSLFYPEFSNEDKVRLYSVFGGVPYYNRLIDSKKSVKQNIIDLIASPGSRLETEVTMYLKSEISKMTNAYEVFESLSKGYTRYSDILSQSKVSSSPTLSDILDKLIRMDIIKKESPINDENNRKKVGYYISDSLTLFYFKYIFRNLSRLNVMNPDVFFDRFINSDFEEKYVPKIFETICKQFLIRKNRNAELENDFEKVGKYYYDDSRNHKNGEFDIVTLNNDEYTFYEAKFRSSPLSQNLISNEIEQVKKTGFMCKKYGFFSRSGFENIEENNKQNLILFDLNDIYFIEKNY